MKIGCSPITGTVYAGTTRVSKGQEMWVTKKDVTDMATASVAESLLIKEESFCFETRGKKYKLSVKEEE